MRMDVDELQKVVDMETAELKELVSGGPDSPKQLKSRVRAWQLRTRNFSKASQVEVGGALESALAALEFSPEL